MESNSWPAPKHNCEIVLYLIDNHNNQTMIGSGIGDLLSLAYSTEHSPLAHLAMTSSHTVTLTCESDN